MGSAIRTITLALVALGLAACATAPAAPAKPAAAPPAVGAPAAGAPASASATAPAQAVSLPPIRVAYVAAVGSMAPLWMAKESGAFERAGVPVEMVFVQANAAIASLIAGEIDFVQTSAPPVVTAGIQDADIAFIAGALNNMIHTVHVQQGISGGDALRGKLWGSDRPGTPTDFATVVALDKLRLRPPGDLQVLNVGTSEQLLAALLSGQLAATVLVPPQSFAAEDAGFGVLTDLYDVPYQTIGLAGLRSRFAALEPSLVPFLRAYREGIERYSSDKALALKVFEEYGKLSDPSVLERTYEFYRARGWNRSLTVSEAGVQNVIDFIGRGTPAAQGVPAERFIEHRYVQQLGPN